MTAPFSLAGEAALVTGASSGLGRHFARTLARQGARVAVAARRIDRLEDLAAEIRSQGGEALPVALPVALDVTDTKSVAAAVATAESGIGPISILVNNAGTADDRPLLETSDADWQSVIDTNLNGAWSMARETARAMSASGVAGRIVNIVSILGLTATARVHAYAASKAGLIQLTKTLAVELARDGIRVNAIAPGYVDTELTHDLLSGPARTRLLKRVPMRRFGDFEDLDGALLLLASDASRYMTGGVLVVDGGMSLSTF